MVAPGNVQVNVVNSTLAEVHWDPVPLKSIRGHLQGYKASKGRSHMDFPDVSFIWHTLDQRMS